MFGYVRPSVRDLPEEELDRFRAMYCGLCHTLSRRYGLTDGTWTPESRRDFATTLDHSIHQMAAAFELWDFGVWTPVLQSTFYGGLFQVGKAVLDGSFHRPSRKNIREIEETE